MFIESNLAFAGGDYVLGKILSFFGDNGNHSLSFKQTNINDKPLLMGCHEFNVKVKYENVPWYSWLPFVESTHPTKKQTTMAASQLLDALNKNREVGFGSMGGGLISTKEKCTFSSKGLMLEFDNVILSFHDPL